MWNVLPYTNKSVDFTREGAADYGSYRQVQYFVTIQRKATYYIWVIIAPTCIINALSIAGIFAPFSNGGEREEKVSFSISVFYSSSFNGESIPSNQLINSHQFGICLFLIREFFHEMNPF
jgi:hypothetical protein